MLAIVGDKELHIRANEQGENYWELYLHEIAHHLGLPPTPLAPDELASIPSHISTILLSRQSGTHLSPASKQSLINWVNAGGVLVGFGVQGLDELFGIQTEELLHQPIDDFTIAGYFELRVHPLTREVHPFMFVEQQLLVLSDIVIFQAKDCQEIGHLYSSEHMDMGRPLVTWRKQGTGATGYFGFDLPKTVWLLHQGRPLPSIAEGETLLRTAGLQILGENSTKIAYADEMILLVQNMLAFRPLPFVYQIPPKDGTIPDALFFYSGDEYTGPVEQSIQASNWMASKGLPYHINIASELHPMTHAEWEQIQANSHEVSSYIWVKYENGQILNAQTIQAQSDKLLERFGTRPGSVLIGSTQWSGGVEPARWLAAAGATADNTFVGSRFQGLDHPLMNGPFFGFGYGTAFPFYFYDDAEHHNDRIEILEQPIIGYEIGHRGSLPIRIPRDAETDTLALEDIHFAVDMALRYHFVANLFYHPYYIVYCPLCRAAIEELLRYIQYGEANVLHMANNRVADWWKARRQSSISNLSMTPSSIDFSTHSLWSEGIIVKLQIGPATPAKVTCDGRDNAYEIRKEFGGTWLYTPSRTESINSILTSTRPDMLKIFLKTEDLDLRAFGMLQFHLFTTGGI